MAVAHRLEMAEEDACRLRFYALLAALLAAPPDTSTLDGLSRLEGDDGSAMGCALADLAGVTRTTTSQAVEDEFNALFIGLTRGEIVPYASYYLTGFLNEKPLAELRGDLATLGIERAPGRFEPEDHIGFLCEVMYGLIAGTFGDATLAVQHRFFDKHIASWADAMFADLETASSARFYRPVATIGRLFLGIERESFAMAGNG